VARITPTVLSDGSCRQGCGCGHPKRQVLEGMAAWISTRPVRIESRMVDAQASPQQRSCLMRNSGTESAHFLRPSKHQPGQKAQTSGQGLL